MENLDTAQGDIIDLGIGDTATPNLASGKICVIDRGTISFHDKVKNCEDSGGIGAVIINNEPGMLYATLGDASTNTTSIPAVGAAQEDGPALKAATSITVSVTSTEYGFLSGTSMATPAVSGVAALVWSNHPTCTGSQIRQVLKDTALDAGAAGKDDYFGHGIVQAADADDYITIINFCDGGTTPPTGGELTLTASGYKVKGSQRVDLTWSSAASANVDVYQNGSSIGPTPNDGALTINLNTKGGGTYTFQVCEAGTSTCSETAIVVF
jgi:subtilisin family serine protease